jgi:hypothetical protein
MTPAIGSSDHQPIQARLQTARIIIGIAVSRV